MSETEFKIGGRIHRPSTGADIEFFAIVQGLEHQVPDERFISVGAGAIDFARRSATAEGRYVSLDPRSLSEVEKLALPARPYAD